MKMKVCAAAAVLCTLLSFSSEAASRTEKFLYTGPAKTLTENLFMEDDEVSRRLVFEKSRAETGVSDSEEDKERLDQIYERFFKSGALSRSYLCYVTDGDEINGFMRAGGVIGITRGAMETYSDSEAAFLLAHELAHGELGHEEKKLRRLISADEALAVYTAKSDREAMQLAGELLARYETDKSYTDSQEKEADRLALSLMMKAGYNPGGSLAAVQKLINLHDGDEKEETKRFHTLINDMELLSDKRIRFKDGKIFAGTSEVLLLKAGVDPNEPSRLMAFGALVQIMYMKLPRFVDYRQGGLFAGSVFIAKADNPDNGYMEASLLESALMNGK